MEDKKLKKEVSKHSDFEFNDNGKIHCTLTGHDLAPRLADFQAYLQSKSYKMAQDRNHDFTQYEPYLVDYKKDPKKLYCRLTNRVLNKLKSLVEKHVNGKKYKRLLQLNIEAEAKEEELKKRKEEKLTKNKINNPKKKATEKPGKEKKGEMEVEEDEDHLGVEEMDELYGGNSDEEGDEDWEDADDDQEVVEVDDDDEDEDDDDLKELEEEEVKVSKIANKSKKIQKVEKKEVKRNIKKNNDKVVQKTKQTKVTKEVVMKKKKNGK